MPRDLSDSQSVEPLAAKELELFARAADALTELRKTAHGQAERQRALAELNEGLVSLADQLAAAPRALTALIDRGSAIETSLGEVFDQARSLRESMEPAIQRIEASDIGRISGQLSQAVADARQLIAEFKNEISLAARQLGGSVQLLNDRLKTIEEVGSTTIKVAERIERTQAVILDDLSAAKRADQTHTSELQSIRDAFDRLEKRFSGQQEALARHNESLLREFAGRLVPLLNEQNSKLAELTKRKGLFF